MMSRHAAIDLDFGDGTFTFRLGLSELEELERKCDRSIFQIARRLSPQVRDARSFEIVEVIRIGLIGGGMKPVDALGKVRKYVDERPLEESRDTAYVVALAALERLHSSDLEKASSSGEAPAPRPSASTSAPSEQAQSS